MAGEVVLAYKEFVLTGEDLDVLKNPCYVTDEIIGFYFSYLSESSDNILLLVPSVSYSLASGQDVDVSALEFGRKQVILFPINDVYGADPSFEDNGTHWSILVYDRISNAFYHHDTKKGTNNFAAKVFFDKVKGLVGTSDLAESNKKKNVIKRKNRSKDVSPVTKQIGPSFAEVDTPQQLNDYDCGIYVMAIAKVICEWYSSSTKDKNWFAYMTKRVNSSIEFTMRSEIVKLIEDKAGENRDK